MNTNKLLDYCLFIDLDGVLVDFDFGVKKIFRQSAMDVPDRVMWPRLARTPNFYTDLPWLPDGKELWNFVLRYNPYILTGLPMGGWAEAQKREWCARELGPEIPVITCLSRHKHIQAKDVSENRTPILVDDREKLRVAWESVGGIFILHTSAAESIAQLKTHGF